MNTFIKKWFSKTEEPKEYVLFVTTKHEDGGYSSRQYGWGENLMFTQKEAILEKEKLKNKFHEVEIFHKSEQI